MTMIKFEIGKTYSTRSACDYDCIFSFKVLDRSAKFVTVEDKHGHVRRCGVKNAPDYEWTFPQGTYSMAPVISADRETV